MPLLADLEKGVKNLSKKDVVKLNEIAKKEPLSFLDELSARTKNQGLKKASERKLKEAPMKKLSFVDELKERTKNQRLKKASERQLKEAPVEKPTPRW